MVVRPTPALVRAALMNALGSPFAGGQVLDLYAGSGAVGLEFLSHGAAAAVFVEHAPASLAALRRNIATCRAEEVATVLPGDALAALARLAGTGRRFDWIFLDPPYADAPWAELLHSLADGRLLTRSGQVLTQSRRGLPPSLLGPPWVLLARRRYGDATVERLAWQSAEPPR
jgi:16S rRNA (guanine(966)-N(2))-methyltransferase RsmD